MEMVLEVERQFKEQPDLLLPNTHLRPDYDRCVAISTRSALREMIAPGESLVVMFDYVWVWVMCDSGMMMYGGV
jgi:K(+)-stimulated pyrophosphate-energized sodium pump